MSLVICLTNLPKIDAPVDFALSEPSEKVDIEFNCDHKIVIFMMGSSYLLRDVGVNEGM